MDRQPDESHLHRGNLGPDTKTRDYGMQARENLIRSLPSSLCQLQRLQVLDLGDNEIDQLVSVIGSRTEVTVSTSAGRDGWHGVPTRAVPRRK